MGAPPWFRGRGSPSPAAFRGGGGQGGSPSLLSHLCCLPRRRAPSREGSGSRSCAAAAHTLPASQREPARLRPEGPKETRGDLFLQSHPAVVLLLLTQPEPGRASCWMESVAPSGILPRIRGRDRDPRGSYTGKSKCPLSMCEVPSARSRCRSASSTLRRPNP